MEKEEFIDTLILVRDVTYKKAQRERERAIKSGRACDCSAAARYFSQADTLNLVIDMIGDEEFCRGIRKFYEQYEKEDN